MIEKKCRHILSSILPNIRILLIDGFRVGRGLIPQ
jgi:hypothetical protein